MPYQHTNPNSHFNKHLARRCIDPEPVDPAKVDEMLRQVLDELGDGRARE